MEAIESRLPNVESLAAEVLLDTQLRDQDKSIQQTHAQELLTLARLRVLKKKNYVSRFHECSLTCRFLTSRSLTSRFLTQVNLMFLLISFLCYCIAISSQRDPTAYEIESRWPCPHSAHQRPFP